MKEVHQPTLQQQQRAKKDIHTRQRSKKPITVAGMQLNMLAFSFVSLIMHRLSL